MNDKLLQVETHDFKYNSNISKSLKSSLFYSKNLYNISLYLCRQNYFKYKTGLNYESLYKIIKNDLIYKQDYYSLPTKVSQQTIKNVANLFRGFVNAVKDYRRNPSKYKAKPKLPKYKDKTNGKYLLTYTKQSISQKKIKNHLIKLSSIDFDIKTKARQIQQVRIMPKAFVVTIEVVYYKDIQDMKLPKDNIISIDLGVNNLTSITSNRIGFTPILVNGRSVKSVNQYYNKMKAYYQSLLPSNQYNSKRINKISYKRKKKINHYFHNTSKFIIDLCLSNSIGTIVIGKNQDWKQNINIGKKNNQSFVFIPYNVLINQIKYKAKLYNIDVIETEESYTSKCSFIDKEEIGKHENYLGKRIKRGLFRSKDGKLINSDVNGSYNICRKAFPKSFDKGIEEFVVTPKSYTLCKI